VGILDIKDEDKGAGGGAQEIRNAMCERIGSFGHKRQKAKGVGAQETKNVKCEGIRSYRHKQRKGRGKLKHRNKKHDGTPCPYEEKEGGIKAFEIKNVKCDGF